MKNILGLVLVSFLVVTMLVIDGCQTITKQPEPSPVVTPVPMPTATPTTPSQEPGPQPALSWGHPDWDREMFSLVLHYLPSFNLAYDRSQWCAKYDTLSDQDKSLVWATLAVEIAKHESAFNPKDKFYEKTMGYYSIGLYSLSYPDNMSWCKMDKATDNLTDPIVNIQCAIPKMAQLVAKDKLVTASNNRGLARYWSVMWAGHEDDEIKKVVSNLSVCK